MLLPSRPGEHINNRVLSNPPVATMTSSAATVNERPDNVLHSISVARALLSSRLIRTQVESVIILRLTPSRRSPKYTLPKSVGSDQRSSDDVKTFPSSR